MKTISVYQLHNMLQSGEEVHLIDCREPAEYEAANLKGKLIPLGNIANCQIDEIEDWRTEEVIIHCRSGARSAQACMMLEQMGFTNTVNVQGGILAWQEAFGSAL
jgi:rhodanese-related sulfurtransferase